MKKIENTYTCFFRLDGTVRNLDVEATSENEALEKIKDMTLREILSYCDEEDKAIRNEAIYSDGSDSRSMIIAYNLEKENVDLDDDIDIYEDDIYNLFDKYHLEGDVYEDQLDVSGTLENIEKFINEGNNPKNTNPILTIIYKYLKDKLENLSDYEHGEFVTVDREKGFKAAIYWGE